MDTLGDVCEVVCIADIRKYTFERGVARVLIFVFVGMSREVDGSCLDMYRRVRTRYEQLLQVPRRIRLDTLCCKGARESWRRVSNIYARSSATSPAWDFILRHHAPIRLRKAAVHAVRRERRGTE